MNNQRGLSGTLRRTRRTKMPKMAPIPKASRQPMLAGKFDVFSRTSAPAAPAAEPSQYVPLITRSTRPPPRPGAGEKPRDEEIPRSESECGCNGGDQIHRKGQHEQVAPSEAVRQMTE